MISDRTFRRILKNKASLTGLGILLFFALVALFASLICPPENLRDPYLLPQSGYSSDPQPPSREHIFGTSEQQYDLFYGVVWGARTAFKVGFMVVAISAVAGIILGGLAGYFGKWVDELLMRFTDIILAFPSIVLAVVIVSMLGPGLGKVTAALSLVSWPAYARLVRGDVLSVKE
ncbi:MAG: ABC transporter permease, partial [Elusimicrobia bacterium]|nr:ABC transporter permease [Elusimicrobiota bacterium]